MGIIPSATGKRGIAELFAHLIHGKVPTSELGSGTADNTKFLRGDQTWQTVSGSGDVVGDDLSTTVQNIVAYNAVGGKNITELTGTQGDVLYHNGTSWAKLPAGTSGWFLKTQGAGANPLWAATDHGGLLGLLDDDHTQYLLLAGRAPYQTVNGIVRLAGQYGIAVPLRIVVGPGNGDFPDLYGAIELEDAVNAFSLYIQLPDAGLTADRTITIPDDSGTVVLTAATQTLSSKYLHSSTTIESVDNTSGASFRDTSDSTKRLRFNLSSAAGNNAIVVGSGGPNTYTLPGYSGTFALPPDTGVSTRVLTSNGAAQPTYQVLPALASAIYANQGTTTTVLHGNAAGNPSWAAVVEADITLADNTTNDVSITKHGLTPKAPNDTNKFLRGDATWATPSVTATFPKGHIYGLWMSNAADATNDIAVQAGEVCSDDGTTNMVLASAITKQIDAAWAVGTNAGGMNTGAVANSTWYEVHVIKRTDTGVVDVMFTTTANRATLPTNYDKKRRIGWVRRDVATNLAFTQIDDHITLTTPVNDVSATATASATSRTLTAPPSSIARFRASCLGNTGVNAANAIVFSELVETDTAPTTTNGFNSIGSGDFAVIGAGHIELRVNSSSQIRDRAITATGSMAYDVSTFGWIDHRGRLSDT